MAEERIDSLSIEIVSSAEKAVKGLDNIAKSTDKVGKALKNVKTSGLDKVSKDAVDSAKSIENLNSRMESLFAKGEAAGKKFFDVDQMGIKELESKLKTLKSQYSNAMDTINTKLVSGFSGGTTFDNQVIQAGKLATRIDIVKERLDALKSTQDSMKPVDFWDRADWNETPIDTAQVGQALSDMEQEYLSTFSNISSEATNVGQAIQNAIQTPTSTNVAEGFNEVEAEISETATMLQGFKNMLDLTWSSIKNAPKNIGSLIGEKTGIYDYSKEYYTLKDAISKTETEAEALKNQIDSMGAKGQKMPLSEEKLKELNAELDKMKQKLAEIEGQGKGFHMFGKMKDGLSGIGSKIGGLFSQGDSEGTSRAFRSTGKSSNALGKGLKNVLGLMKKLVPNSKSLKGVLGGLGLTSNGLSKSLLRTGKMLKLMIVRMALRGVITGAKEGFQNLIQYSDSTKASMQQLVSSLDYLKNSFAAAFAPAINVAAPILSKFIDYLVSAVNQINQLVSSLLGFSTWTKATKLVSNYGNAVGGVGKAAKETNKQLQPFDELNNLTMNQGGGSGGGSGAGTNYADMFTTEEVDGYWKSIADRIKDSWNFDDADFTWLGASLGEKISEQLDGLIDKHPKIKDNARKIGKALGTTITGFVETPNLGYKVGTVIGNAIDTAVTGLDGFVSNVHWDSVGTFIGQGINGIKDTELIHDVFTLLKNSINGAINFLWSSGNEIDFKGIGGKIGEELSSAVSELDTAKLGEALSTWIRGGLQGITNFLYNTDFQQVGQKLADLLKNIDVNGILWDLSNLAGAILGALGEALLGFIDDNPLGTALVTLLLGIKISGKLTSLGSSIMGEVTTAATTGSAASTLTKGFSKLFSVGGAVFAGVTAAIAGWNLGQYIYNSAKKDENGDNWIDRLAMDIFGTPEYYLAEDTQTTGADVAKQEIRKAESSGAIKNRNNREAAQQAYSEKISSSYDAAIKAGMTAQEAYTYAMQQSNEELKNFTQNQVYASDTLRKYTSGVVEGTADQWKIAYAQEHGYTALREYEVKMSKVKTTLSKLSTPFKNYGTAITNVGTKLKNLIGINDKTKKSNDDFSKSYQSNSDKVTKATTGMSNNIANSRANIIGSMDKIGLSFDGTYNKINTGAENSSKTIDTKFQYMKLMATAHTEEQRKAIEAKYGQMVDTTKTNTGSMSSDVLSKFTTMNTSTSSKSQGMVDVLKKNLGLMKSNTNTETSGMASTVLSKFTAMNNDTSVKSTGMLNAFKTNLASMKSNTNTETSNMQTTISRWSTNVKNLVTNTKGTAKFDVETPTQSVVSKKLEELKNIWGKGGKADFSLNFGASSSSISEMANKAIEKVKQAFNNSGVAVLKNAVSKLKFFAKGGVVDKATLGIFGEAGTEAIMPLERNTEWIGKLSTQIVAEMPSLPTYQSSSNESAILEQNRLLAEQNALLRRIAEKDISISSRDVFNAVRTENDDFINRTGASPFFV